jgi:hypothetical protein
MSSLKSKKSSKKNNSSNMSMSKYKNIHNNSSRFVNIISIIYNTFILLYILNIEDKNCNCFYDWRHDFIKYSSILFITLGFINLKLDAKNNMLVIFLTKISGIANLINIWCIYTYVGILDDTKCKCAIDDNKNMHYFLYVWRYVLIAALVIGIICVLSKCKSL